MSRPKLSVASPPPDQKFPEAVAKWESAASVRERRVEWLLPGRIIQGALAVLEGDTSVGKSTFIAALAASVTTGAPFLGRTGAKPRNVLWLSAEEDPASMIRPRLLAAGAWLQAVHFPAVDPLSPDRRLTLPGSLHDLHEAIQSLNVGLVVVEPLVSHISTGYDLHNDADARAILDPVARLAMSSGATILVTRGLRKDRSGPRTLHGAGSATIGDTARTITCIDWPDRDQPVRILRAVKASGTTPTPAMSYRIESGPLGPVMTSWRALSSTEDSAAEDVPDASERDIRVDAEALLRSALASGPIRATTVQRLADDALISPSSLRRAKTALGVRSVRQGFGAESYCEWEAPVGGFPAPTGGLPGTVAPMAPMRKPRKKRSGKSIDAIETTPPGEGG